METTQRFMRYAAAFEETYKDDDWSRLEEFFAEDAEYHVVGMPLFPVVAQGREQVFAALKAAIDGFDRRFAVRRLEMVGEPKARSARILFDWAGIYEVEGAPSLRIEGSEEALYDAEGRIVKLTDRYSNAMAQRVKIWLAEHEQVLGPARG